VKSSKMNFPTEWQQVIYIEEWITKEIFAYPHMQVRIKIQVPH